MNFVPSIFRKKPAPPVQAAAPSAAPYVSGDLARILRPQAAYRWMFPSLGSVTPTYIESILRGAFFGSHIQVWALFDLMEDTWPRLSKDLNEIKGAVLGLDWKLCPWAEEDTPATDTATERSKLVSNALWKMQPDPAGDENGFKQTLYDLLDAWAKGVSVVEILWHTRTAGSLGEIVAPRATAWVRPDQYSWSAEGRLGLNPQAVTGERSSRGYTSTSYEIGGQQIIEFPENKFLIGISKGKSGHALVASLLRPLAWWWCAANFSADWLMNLAQIFGLPFRWANYQQGAPQATIDKICTMLDTMGSATWAAFPEGTTIELKEAGSLGENSPQGDLLDRADRNCDLLILGQTLTTEQGARGSQALGKVHEGVKQERVNAAAEFIENVINQQLIPAILQLNYGDVDEAPEIEGAEHEAKDVLMNAQRDEILLAAGLELPRDWLYKRHDIPLPTAGEETISAPKPVQPDPAARGDARPTNGNGNGKLNGNGNGKPADYSARRSLFPPLSPVKAGFDPGESRDDSGQWTVDASGTVTHGPKQAIGHTLAEDGEFFHGTSAHNAEAILKSGIKPTDKTLGFKAAFVGQNKNLAFAYGAGSAAQTGSNEVAVVVVKDPGKHGMFSPKGARNIAYHPKGVKADAIDRIEIYRANAGKDEAPLRVLRRPGSIHARFATRADLMAAAAADSPSTLENKSLHPLAKAVATDLQPISKRLSAILQIKDNALFEARLRSFLSDVAQLQNDVGHDPQMAIALANIISSALGKGFAERGRIPNPQTT